MENGKEATELPGQMGSPNRVWGRGSANAILYSPSSQESYGSGSSGGLTDGGPVGRAAAVGDGAGFITGMKRGFVAAGSSFDGGIARSTTVISPAAWAR